MDLKAAAKSIGDSGALASAESPPPTRTVLTIAQELISAQLGGAKAKHNLASYKADVKRLTNELRNFGKRPRKAK
jgi:hypothetical protein